MNKIEEVSKIIADCNFYISNGKKCLFFVDKVPTLARGGGNLVVVEFAENMPHARKLEWGDEILNKLGQTTNNQFCYGKYLMQTVVGKAEIDCMFGTMRIKFI